MVVQEMKRNSNMNIATLQAVPFALLKLQRREDCSQYPLHCCIFLFTAA